MKIHVISAVVRKELMGSSCPPFLCMLGAVPVHDNGGTGTKIHFAYYIFPSGLVQVPQSRWCKTMKI